MDLPELQVRSPGNQRLCMPGGAFASAHICLSELWHMKIALTPFLIENSSAALLTPCLVLT